MQLFFKKLYAISWHFIKGNKPDTHTTHVLSHTCKQFQKNLNIEQAEGFISIWAEWKGKLGRWNGNRVGLVIADMCNYEYGGVSLMHLYDKGICTCSKNEQTKNNRHKNLSHWSKSKWKAPGQMTQASPSSGTNIFFQTI